MNDKIKKWQLTVGLEVHIQLSTQTKMFCPCPSKYGATPNTLICPICLGLPGALPSINEEAINMALRLGHALNFKINEKTEFSRKNYYYPDLPKGYQISQFDKPICVDGNIEFEKNDKKNMIGITRAHLEEDSGKLIHHSNNYSFVDLNRAGSPLIEIVSEPEIHSSEDARLYLEKLKQIIEYINISDCDMEKGNLRVDINVSVNKQGDNSLGTRREIKNLNSFKAVQKAINFEFSEQVKMIENGDKIIQSTLTWDEKNNKTKILRKKEDAHDYRYFPEPDLPPLLVSNNQIESAKAELPELPNEKIIRFRKEYSLKNQDIDILISNISLANYFEKLVSKTNLPQITANWILVEILHYLNSNNIEINHFPIETDRMAELIKLFDNKELTNLNAKKLFNLMINSKEKPLNLIEKHNLKTIKDDDLLEKAVQDIFKKNPSEFDRLKDGDNKLIGFFMGQAMRALKGKANPKSIQEIINKLIG